MFNVVDALRDLLAAMDKPRSEVNVTILTAKLMEIAGHIQEMQSVPSEFFDAMPPEMRAAAANICLGVLASTLEGK